MGTKIYNSDLTKELRIGARIQTSTDGTPSEIADKVVPVMEVNPRLLRVSNLAGGANSGISNATNTAIAADPNADIFITELCMGIAKDATSDAATGVLSCVITLNGANVSLISIPILTLTAQSEVITLSLKNPIKLDRNTGLRCAVPTFTVGTCMVSLNAIGYKTYNFNA